MLKRQTGWRLRTSTLVMGATAFALSACGEGGAKNPDGGGIHPTGGNVGTGGGGGGSGGSAPSPDAGDDGNPVIPPPMGLDPNNQVIPGPLPGDQHFNFDAVLARGEMLRPIMDARQAALLQQRYDLADRPSSVSR